MTTTLDTLEERLSKAVQDFLETDTTTNITTNNSIISTNLKAFDHSSDDYFLNWWVYITEGNNSGVERQISAYTSSTGTLTVRGAALLAETGAVTIRLYRYSRTDKVQAIQQACRGIYPSLWRPVDNRTLVAGNWLLDGHMEVWSSATAMTFWGKSAGTLAKTTTDDLYRGPKGSTSCKLTSNDAGDYLVQSSNTYPRLLDLMGQTISFKVWALPQVGGNPTIVIYTLKYDGTAQTLTSTTSAALSRWVMLELENQVLNDDLVQIEFRLLVNGASKYTYFDAARVTGVSQRYCLLPEALQTGAVDQVHLQSGGYSDDICDDLNPKDWSPIYGSKFVWDGAYKYIELPNSYQTPAQIRLTGIAPLESLSAATDTISLDDPRVDYLVAQAQIELADILAISPSSQDVSRFEAMRARGERRKAELQHFRMNRRGPFVNLPVYEE